MKRHLLFSVAAAMATMSLMAGGLVTNTNQSASWVRNPARDASRGIDAVYYNPAGIMALGNGLHFSISNQSIFQDKKIVNNFNLLNNGGEYKGSVSAPLFPGVYGVYKMDKLAFSFGFNPIGGGGGATFDKGLPSFELPLTQLIPSLTSNGVPGITNYNAEAYFEGSSVFFGYQGGVTYKINDMLSVFGGARFVTAKNTYLGHLNNIQVGSSAGMQRADALLNFMASGLGQIIAIPSGLQQLVDNGIPSSFTMSQVVALNNPAFTAANQTAIETGLGKIGVDQATANGMTLAQIQAAVTAATPTLSGKQATLLAQAHLLRDQSADVEQTGSGITPMLGINLTPMENLNIGIKYEFATKLELTNKTAKDFTTGYTQTGDTTTMFPNGEKIRNDMPAMLSIGVDYTLLNKLRISVGTHYYMDKNANYGKKIEGVYVDNSKVIDKNFYEVALGLEYNITDKLLVSAGYLMARTGVNSLYQNDLSYSNNSNTIGFGAAYKINDMLSFNLGAAITSYEDAVKTLETAYVSATGTPVYPTETYSKTTMIIAAGIDLSFGK